MEQRFSEFFPYYFEYFLGFNTLFTTGTNPLLQRETETARQRKARHCSSLDIYHTEFLK